MLRFLDEVNSKCASLISSSFFLLLSGLSGAVCRLAQPANPSGAVQLPATEVLLRAAVGWWSHAHEHTWLFTKIILCSLISVLVLTGTSLFFFAIWRLGLHIYFEATTKMQCLHFTKKYSETVLFLYRQVSGLQWILYCLTFIMKDQYFYLYL